MFAYVLLLSLVALEVPLALSLRDRVDAEVRSQAQAQADVLAATAAGLLAPRNRANLRALVATGAETVRGRVIAVDASGRLLADSVPGTRLAGSYRSRPEVAAALGGHSVQRTRVSRSLRQDLLATAVPIRLGPGAPAGAIRITQSMAAVHRAVRRSVVGLVGIGVLVLLLGLAAAAILARQIARPTHRLADTARGVAGGDLTARARVEGSAEQQGLARAFNEMTGRVQRLLHAQQAFVADASHQLRTPLTGLRLRLEEARDLAPQPAVSAATEAGMREVDRLAQIVDELLVLSRAGERELPGERLSLATAAERARERWTRRAAQRGQRILIECDQPTTSSVWCARADLDRILDLLVENALCYSPPHSTVRLTVSDGTIAVIDEGPGLAPGEEDVVFERFHRGSAGRNGPPGTGLGLPIARELAREWDAELALVAGSHRGARAELRFPPRLVPPSVAPSRDGVPEHAHGDVRALTEPATPRVRHRTLPPVGASTLAGVAGLVVAALATFAASGVTRQRIGLSAEPTSAGDRLVAVVARPAKLRPTTVGDRHRPSSGPAPAPAPSSGTDGEGRDD